MTSFDDRTVSNAESVSEQKAALRKRLRSMRRALTAEQIEEASLALCARVVGLSEFTTAATILSYIPAKGEIDVRYINRIAQEMGKTVAYPLCIEDGGLRLLVPNGDGALRPGSYGIPEPVPELSKELRAEDIDLIIVPAVAFTADCRRLGQGGGYYDRLLMRAGAVTVGVGYDFQLLEDLPTEPHDRRLDLAVTPSAVFVKNIEKK